MISQNHLAEKLSCLGLEAGDTVFVHSDLTPFGIEKDPEGRFSLSLTDQVMFNALWQILGPDGTLVVPSFSYGLIGDGPFDPETAGTVAGALSKRLLKSDAVYRTSHPMFSLAVMGHLKDRFFSDDTHGPVSGFGIGSSYEALVRCKAKWLMAGVPYCSLKDHVEILREVPFRYPKLFRMKMAAGGRSREILFSHQVRYQDAQSQVIPFYDGLTEAEKQALPSVTCGKGRLRMIDTCDAVRLIEKKLGADPFSFVTGYSTVKEAMSFLRGLGRDKDPSAPVLRFFAFGAMDDERWAWMIPETLAVRSGLAPKYAAVNCQDISGQWWAGQIPAHTACVLVSGSRDEVGAHAALAAARAVMGQAGNQDGQDERSAFISELLAHDLTLYKVTR